MRHMPLLPDIDKCSGIMWQTSTRKSVVKFDFVTYRNQFSAKVFSCKFVASFIASFVQNITGEYCNTVFTSPHIIHHIKIVFQFQCKQICLIQKSSFNKLEANQKLSTAMEK